MAASEDSRPGADPAGYRFATSDPARAAARLADWYRVTGGVTISGDTDGFQFSQHVLTGQGFAVTRFQCSVAVGYRGPLGDLLCVDQVHAGRLSLATAHGEVLSRAGDICLIPPQEAWRATTEAVDLAPLMLDRAAVAAHAAVTCGVPPEALVFTGLEPVSPAVAAHWKAAVAHVRDCILGSPEVAAAPLVRAQAFRMLADGVLTAFPNTAMDALVERPAPGTLHAGPAVIRRAVEFIEANAHRPIGVGDIATAVRISARSLQHAFRKHRGSTPMEYLKRVRMERAHRDLQAADPTRGDTVASIAARWGLTHLGRFSVEYRRRFGCSPSQTLRR